MRPYPKGRAVRAPVRCGAPVCTALLLASALPGPAWASRDLCELFPGHPTLCPDPCVPLKQGLATLAEKFERDYERWQNVLKTHRCHRIKHGETVETYKSALDSATKDVKDTSENIKDALKKAKEHNCSLTDPRKKFEPPKCKRARVDYACYKKLEEDLKWELTTMFGQTEAGGTAGEGEVCKQVKRNADYGRCREIVYTDLPDVQEALTNAKNNVDATCAGGSSSETTKGDGANGGATPKTPGSAAADTAEGGSKVGQYHCGMFEEGRTVTDPAYRKWWQEHCANAD